MTTDYETSINELSQRLEELVQSVIEEVALHKQRLDELRGLSHGMLHPNEAKGAVLAGAHALLSTVENLELGLDGVREVLKEQHVLLETLHQESRTDVLTGVLNRRAFEEEFARRTTEAKHYKRPLGLLMLDIDHFKSVNDTYGHAAGDKILKGVANVLANSLRESDVLTRIGGEEFAALLPDANLLNACRAAERARAAIAKSSIFADEIELGVTISMGVAIVGDSPGQAFEQADDALYAAKRAGRNRVFVFQDGYCHPLQQEPASQLSIQRRRWMRFAVESFDVRVRQGKGLWRVAHVLDESLTGIGVLLEGGFSVQIGGMVEIDYSGDLRVAEVKNIAANLQGNPGQCRLGLRWHDLPKA